MTLHSPSPLTQDGATTPNPSILQVGPVNPRVAEALETDPDAMVLPDDGPARSEAIARFGAGVLIAVCSGTRGVGTELMEALPQLEAVISFGVGVDSTDVTQARARGIVVSNTPDVLTDCVADLAISLYLDTLRRVSAADRFLRAGNWAAGQRFPLTRRASHRRVGILGLGRIGTAIAHRLEAFGCEIHYHNRRERPDSHHTFHRSVTELAEVVDVLVIAAAGGPESAGSVGAAELAALGPQGHLINIARGSVVDEDALIAALQQGTIAGAGLDVFAHEPQVPQALLEMDNVVLLPHVGSGTAETRAEMADLVLQNLASFRRDGTLVTPLD